MMRGERQLPDLFSHADAVGEDVCAMMGTLPSPFYSLGGLPSDLSFSLCNVGCERTVVKFPIEEQGLPGIPWDTPETLMPTRHFHDCCFDLLESTSSTPWSSSGYDEELLLDLSADPEDLGAVLLDPVVGGGSEFACDLCDPLQIAVPDVTIHGRVEEFNSMQHFSKDSSLCSALDAAEVAAQKDLEQAAQGRRARGGKKRSRRASTKADWMTMEFLESGGFFDMPLAEAARQLDMSIAVFKPKVRKMGIKRWPSRKRNSLRRLMETAQIMGKPTNHFDGDIHELSKLLEAECKSYKGDSENWHIIQKVRDTYYKTRFLHRHGKIETKAPSTPLPATPFLPSASSCSSPSTKQTASLQPDTPPEGRTFRVGAWNRARPAARSGSAPPGVVWGAHGSRERRRRGRRAASIF